jgi:hypothetical protein
VATLLAVIVNMIGFDATSPINCQVNPRRISLFFLYRELTSYDPKAWVTSELVSTLDAIGRAWLSPSLVLRLRCHFRRLALGCASRVRVLCDGVVFLKQITHVTMCYQGCYLGTKHYYSCDHNWHMVDQPWIPHP